MDSTTHNQPHQLNVNHFKASYYVPKEHPTPFLVKSKLDDIVTKSLPTFLEKALNKVFNTDSPALYFIKDLHIDFTADVGLDVDSSSRNLAKTITAELLRVLSQRGFNNSYVFFPDRSAYIAQFVLDLVDGSARHKWYYHNYNGLRILSNSSAIRTVLLNEGEIGLQAILNISEQNLERVIAILTHDDARRLAQGLALIASASEKRADLEPVWSICKGNQTIRNILLLVNDFDWRAVLHLYLEVYRIIPKQAGSELLSLARTIVSLSGLFGRQSQIKPDRLVTILSENKSSDLYEYVGSVAAEQLMPLLGTAKPLLEQIIHHINTLHRGAPVSRQRKPREYSVSRFGGAFLLLPFIKDIHFEKYTASWPDKQDVSNAQLLRFLVLLKCLGSQNALAALNDSLLRDLLEISPDFTRNRLTQWFDSIDTSTHRSNLLQLCRDSRDDPDNQSQQLALLNLQDAAESTALLIDCKFNRWLEACSLNKPGSVESLFQRLDTWLLQNDTTIISDEIFTKRLSTKYPHLEIVSRQSLDEREIEKHFKGVPILSMLDNTQHELDYLSAQTALSLPHDLDLLLSIIAQRVMRAFARRLPGFGFSSMQHLFAHFLDISAKLVEEPERYLVYLGKPPLNMILSMTGMARQQYDLPWLADRSFYLQQGSDGDG